MKNQGPKRNDGTHCGEEKFVPENRSPPQGSTTGRAHVLKIDLDNLEHRLSHGFFGFYLALPALIGPWISYQGRSYL